MNLPNSVRITPVRLFVAALSFFCIPALSQNVVAAPAPAPAAGAAAPASAPEPIATPAPAATIAAPAAAPTPADTPAPAAAVTPAPAVTVTATPDSAPAPALDKNAQMAAIQTTMTENMAKAEAADVARRANEDSEQAGKKRSRN
jgi:hypothetical protein